MSEYLASGRPILVHAPADSYVSRYFTEHQCGVVVGRNEPSVLAEAIDHIIHDGDLRKKCGENARIRAKVDFTVEAARAGFSKVFQPTGGG
jgi:glycosyltransferase involved in cell wall biosynthesis